MTPEYFSHPLVNPNTVQAREYQLAISKEALNQNTLVILPTGLGKTAVSLFVMAERLTGDQKVLLVAPTKPLCEQHHKSFEKFLPYTAVRLLTGELQAPERLKEWNDAQVIIATPQTVENDLKSHTYSLDNVSLLVIDEAHRAVGGYAYTFIAGEYNSTATNPLILAMTASPGGDEKKVDQIKDALFIEKVIIKTEEDEDVKPYMHEKEILKLWLELPDLLLRASTTCKDIVTARCKDVQKTGFKISIPPKQNQLTNLRNHFTGLIAQKDGTGFELARLYGEIMKMRHAAKVAETQGLIPLRKFLNKIFTEGMKSDAKGATKRLVQEPTLKAIFDEVSEAGNDEIHPKAVRLPGIVQTNLKRNPEMKILIFAEFRDTVSLIVTLLKTQGIKASAFTGQATKDGEKGMSQKKQTETLDRFRSGEIRVLVSTSVGEEGLDIPSCDLVIFYEPIPSEVRTIQRRGRTGRFDTGNVLMMVTKKTQDEVNLYAAQRKEEAMRSMDHTTKQVRIEA